MHPTIVRVDTSQHRATRFRRRKEHSNIAPAAAQPHTTASTHAPLIPASTISDLRASFAQHSCTSAYPSGVTAIGLAADPSTHFGCQRGPPNAFQERRSSPVPYHAETIWFFLLHYTVFVRYAALRLRRAWTLRGLDSDSILQMEGIEAAELSDGCNCCHICADNDAAAADISMQATNHGYAPAAAQSILSDVTDEEALGCWTYVIMLLGTFFICWFLFAEYLLAKQKLKDVAVEFTWEELFQYRLDYYLSTSKWAKPALLLSGTFVLIIIGATLLTAASGRSISASTWVAWTYVADPGTHADAEGTLVRFVSFAITIGGMLVFALMIGIISEGIGEKVDDLKKGKSRVIESRHTLMLGWSDKSLAIIQQLALANESEGGGTIVVLAEQDKRCMENNLQAAVEIREHALDLKGTEVVFRSGNPLMEHDLDKVSVLTARAIIALSPDDVDPDESDSRMVRQVLSLKAFDGLQGHVVVEMQDVDNKDLVELVAPDFAEVIVAHDIIGRLMIQCAREPGLAFVLESLLGFEGSEFYIESWPTLIGKTFLEITCRFNDAIPIGVKTSKGKICINPENTYVIRKGDQILCLAEDNDTYSANDGAYNLKCGKIPMGLSPKQELEKMLFCGWRRDMADMIMQLDEYVTEGSELWLFNSVPTQERQELLKDKGHKDELRTKRLTIKNAVGNPIVRRDLQRIEAVDNDGRPTGDVITLDEFDSLLILADAVAIENGADMQSSDSRSLASLLIIQDIQRQLWSKKQARNGKIHGKRICHPISEILDTRTRSLLRVANCKESAYVMSNEIVSAAIAQVAEDRDMNSVLGELLSAEGCESYIRDISYYMDVKNEGKKSFWDVALRARQRREVAVGYKPRQMSFSDAADLILNPPNKARQRKWMDGDKIIVFAFD